MNINENILETYGFDHYLSIIKEQHENDNLTLARVISEHREQYQVISEKGISKAKLKGSLAYELENPVDYPSIGDFVLIDASSDTNIIHKVLPRYSCLLRKRPGSTIEQQIIANNIDIIFIVMSLNKDFNTSRLGRYLTAAYDSGATPVIVLTKSDLCDDVTPYFIELDKVAFGVDIVITSSLKNNGLDELNKYFNTGTTVVFIGSSGAGKSSLVNALAGEEIMHVNTIREDDSKGRHTTTHRQMIPLNDKFVIIDTPGMREFGTWSEDDGMDESFKDIYNLSKLCKFGDCKHDKEPNCAIKQAIEMGTLSQKRFDQYKKMLKENEYLMRKARKKDMSKKSR